MATLDHESVIQDLKTKLASAEKRVDELLVSNNDYQQQAREGFRAAAAAGRRVEAMEKELSVVYDGADRYRHFKNGVVYQVLHEDVVDGTNGPNNGRSLVIYRSEDDGKIYARSIGEFFEQVPNPNRPIPRVVWRFQLLDKPGFWGGQDRRMG